MAIEEKFRLWTDSTSKLLSWLQEKEMELSDLGVVREDADDLYRQISAAKVNINAVFVLILRKCSTYLSLFMSLYEYILEDEKHFYDWHGFLRPIKIFLCE